MFIRGIVVEKILLFDPKIDHFARCNRSSARKKKQERKAEPSIDKKEHISIRADQDPLVRRTLRDYSMPNTNNYKGAL